MLEKGSGFDELNAMGGDDAKRLYEDRMVVLGTLLSLMAFFLPAALAHADAPVGAIPLPLDSSGTRKIECSESYFIRSGETGIQRHGIGHTNSVALCL